MTIRVIKRIENMFQTEKRPSGYPTYLVMCSECGKQFPMIKYEIGKTGTCQKCANTGREGRSVWKKNKTPKTLGKGYVYKKFHEKRNNIKLRCEYPCVHGFKNYGGRGIKVAWNSFEEFKKDMYESYVAFVKKHGEENTTIDRIDVNGDYCKENCRWQTMREQQSNKRNNHHVIYRGKEYPTIKGLCDMLGKNYPRVFRRITTYGWSVEDAIEK